MAKRLRGSAISKSLTGGTGDVKPQLLSILGGVQSAVDLSIQVTQPTPVPRVGTTPGRATIMEILKVWLMMEPLSTDEAYSGWIYLTTRAIVGGDVAGQTSIQATALVLEPTVIASQIRTHQLATSGATITQGQLEVDLTDNAGNGVLVATDNLFLEGDSQSAVATMRFGARILYRLFDASILEYVGIVQSQQ